MCPVCLFVTQKEKTGANRSSPSHEKKFEFHRYSKVKRHKCQQEFVQLEVTWTSFFYPSISRYQRACCQQIGWGHSIHHCYAHKLCYRNQGKENNLISRTTDPCQRKGNFGRTCAQNAQLIIGHKTRVLERLKPLSRPADAQPNDQSNVTGCNGGCDLWSGGHTLDHRASGVAHGECSSTSCLESTGPVCTRPTHTKPIRTNQVWGNLFLGSLGSGGRWKKLYITPQFSRVFIKRRSRPVHEKW